MKHTISLTTFHIWFNKVKLQSVGGLRHIGLASAMWQFYRSAS